PRDLAVHVDGDLVSLTWTPPDDNDVVRYRLRRDSVTTGYYSSFPSLQLRDCFESGEPLLCPSHRYEVVAVDHDDNESDPSNVVEAFFSKPRLSFGWPVITDEV